MTDAERLSIAVIELADRLSPGGDAMQRAVVADAIARSAKVLARRDVHRARLYGASWADVGRAFGITRQSAHQRFR
jgi:hypothetical protein